MVVTGLGVRTKKPASHLCWFAGQQAVRVTADRSAAFLGVTEHQPLTQQIFKPPFIICW